MMQPPPDPRDAVHVCCPPLMRAARRRSREPAPPRSSRTASASKCVAHHPRPVPVLHVIRSARRSSGSARAARPPSNSPRANTASAIVGAAAPRSAAEIAVHFPVPSPRRRRAPRPRTACSVRIALPKDVRGDLRSGYSELPAFHCAKIPDSSAGSIPVAPPAGRTPRRWSACPRTDPVVHHLHIVPRAARPDMPHDTPPPSPASRRRPSSRDRSRPPLRRSPPRSAGSPPTPARRRPPSDLRPELRAQFAPDRRAHEQQTLRLEVRVAGWCPPSALPPSTITSPARAGPSPDRSSSRSPARLDEHRDGARALQQAHEVTRVLRRRRLPGAGRRLEL